MLGETVAGVAAALCYALTDAREGWRSEGHENDIATNGGQYDPLTPGEIDDLCETLNTSA